MGDGCGEADSKAVIEAVDTSPHYVGHRERLRTRFMEGGPDALQDYELLELLLARTIPRRDTKPLAKELLAQFGSFPDVLAASPERLRSVKGLGGGQAIIDLKLVHAAGVRMLRRQVLNRPALTIWSALLDYCTAAMACSMIEQFRILFLDRKNNLIADEVHQQGTVDHARVYVREVVKRALELSASGIILVHNHPSGDTTPSRADIDMTKKIIEAAEKLSITVHDHLIIGRSGHASFRGLKLL